MNPIIVNDRKSSILIAETPAITKPQTQEAKQPTPNTPSTRTTPHVPENLEALVETIMEETGARLKRIYVIEINAVETLAKELVERIGDLIAQKNKTMILATKKSIQEVYKRQWLSNSENKEITNMVEQTVFTWLEID